MLIGMIGMVVLVLLGGCVSSTKMTGAKVYIQQEDWDKAREMLLSAVATTDSNNAEAWFMLGVVYSKPKVDSLQPMLKALEHARKLGYGDTEAIDDLIDMKYGNFYNLGIKALKKADEDKDETRKAKSLNDAIGFFQQAYGVSEKHPEVLLNIGSCYTMLKNLPKATECFAKGFDQFKDDIRFGQNLMTVLYNRKTADTTQTKRLCDSIIVVGTEMKKRFPTELQPLLDMGEAYVSLGKNDLAMASFSEALDLAKDQPDSNKAKIAAAAGNNAYNVRKFDVAVTMYKRALAWDPNYRDVLYNICLSLDKLEKAKEALPYLEKLLELEPDNVDYLELGAIMYTKAGNLKKGQDLLSKCKAKGGCK